jgi:hypothetical protein
MPPIVMKYGSVDCNYECVQGDFLEISLGAFFTILKKVQDLAL